MVVKWLLNNWSLKVFSLLTSILLFAFVSAESSTAVDVEFPLDYRTAADIMITSDAPGTVVVTLKGPWAATRTFGDVAPIALDLATEEPGSVRRRLETADIPVPAGMTVVSVRPAEIEVTLDRRVEKLVAVEVDPLGRPAFGFELLEMRTEPSRVRVEGPMGHLRKLDFLRTRPVNLRDRIDSLQIEKEIRPPPPPLRLVGRSTVTVSIDIAEEEIQRPMELVVKLIGAPEGSTVEPKNVSVTLKGPRRFVDRIKGLNATIDVTDAAAGTLKEIAAPVSLDQKLPERTIIVGALPEVTVTLPPRRRR